jgi:protein-L-isoaspartate(D-aspartate) O-methyltransferase
MCGLREIPFQIVAGRHLGRAALALILLPITGVLAAADSADATFSSARTALVAEVGHDLDRIRPGVADSALRQRVLAAMGRVPRHEFVPASLRAQAYQNRPLPIGHGQTISQPTVVALMTELLAPRAGQRILEVGTGSGYQAAMLAALGAEVYTIEIVPALGETAGRRLAQLGYAKVHTRVGDGYYGWAEHGPYDAILITAATNHIPPKLLEQLKPGGHLAIPLGNPFAQQQLVVATKDHAGRVTTQKVLAVRFVPLTGDAQK